MMERRQAMKTDLGLSDVQKSDIRKAMETAHRDRLRKSTDLKIASLDLRSLLRAERVDEKAIGVKLAEVQAAQGGLLKLRVDSALAMKRILTPEQQKKMSEMRGHGGMGRAQRRMQRHGLGDSGQGRMRRPALRPGRPGDDSDFGDPDFDLLDLDEEGDDLGVIHQNIKVKASVSR